MDHGETWHGGRPRRKPHCVRWGHSSPLKKGHSLPQFSALVRCCQSAAWIKMPLGTEVGFGPGDIALDWDSTPLPKKHSSPHFSAYVCCSQTAGLIKMPCTWYGYSTRPRPHRVRWGPSSPHAKGAQQPHTFRPMSIVVKRSPISATAELFCCFPHVFLGVHLHAHSCYNMPARLQLGTYTLEE